MLAQSYVRVHRVVRHRLADHEALLPVEQHSTLERQKQIAAALDARVRADRESIDGHDDGSSGTQRAREG